MPDQNATDGRLAFVILAGEGVEIMYQTAASVKEDLVKSASVKDAFRAVASTNDSVCRGGSLCRKLSPGFRVSWSSCRKRTTFYGSTEIGYADPAGNIVVFAEHSDA